MTNKKVEILSKPKRDTSQEYDPDKWVSGPSNQFVATEPTKTQVKPAKKKIEKVPVHEEVVRISFDIPKSLHRSIKLACIDRDVNMKDELKRILASEFLS